MNIVNNVLKVKNQSSIVIKTPEKEITYGLFKFLILTEVKKLKKIKKKYFFLSSKNKVYFLTKFYAGILSNKIPILCKFEKNKNKVLKKYFSECPTRKLKKILTIIFTSGSENEPKGVILTRKAFDYTCKEMNKEMNIRIGQKEIVHAPLDHAFALGRCHCTILKNGTIFFDNKETIYNLVENLKSNTKIGLSIIPSVLATLLSIKKLKFLDCFKNIKYVQTGAMRFPINYRKKLLMKTETEIYIHYGLTEMMRVTFLNLRKYKNMINSEGKPFKKNSIKILKNNRSKVGEILVKGKSLCGGYLNKKDWDPKIKNGWYQTGDIGYIEKGFLIYKGRSSNLINFNGRLIHPEYYEEKLDKKFNSKFCMFAKRDKIKDNIICLAVLKNGPKDKDIINFINSQFSNIFISKIFKINKFSYTRTNKLNRKKTVCSIN